MKEFDLILTGITTGILCTTYNFYGNRKTLHVHCTPTNIPRNCWSLLYKQFLQTGLPSNQRCQNTLQTKKQWKHTKSRPTHKFDICRTEASEPSVVFQRWNYCHKLPALTHHCTTATVTGTDP